LTASEPAALPKPIRTWRPMALWAAALLLALGLICWGAAVVVPVARARSVLHDQGNYTPFGTISVDVAKLGGPKRAARALSGYMLLPEKWAPRKLACVELLRQCRAYGVPALKRALVADDVHVRLEAADGLAREPDERTRERVAAVLIAETGSSDGWTRFAAVCTMGHLEPPLKSLLPVIERLLDDGGGFMAPNGPDGEPLTTVREGAIWALGKYGDDAQAFVPRIVNLLDDPNRRIRTAAASALGKIGPGAKEAVPALVRHIADKDREVRVSAASALAEIRPAAKEALTAAISLLSDDDGYPRRAAAGILGRMGPAAGPAIPALERLLRDPDKEVAAAAAEALRKIRGEEPPK
jgi:HEAT repeat protein